MRKFIFLIFLLLLWTPRSAAGEKGPVTFQSPDKQAVLMEVYVSQGCSSCPPAQDWVNTFTEGPHLWTEVVPVVFHVDYWDYLGWKDPFSSRELSQRQRAYRAQGHVNSVYTPGFIVNGKEWRGWFQKQSLPETTAAAGALKATLDSGRLSAVYEGEEKGLILNVALLGVGLQTDITRGENHGRLLREDFVVLSFDRYPSEDGTWQTVYSTDTPHNPPRKALALWVSREDDFTPLQAAGGWLPQ